MKLDSGAEIVNATHYRYDERGALVAQSLPDGSELQYERNVQGQIVALYRQASAWAPFGWGRQAIVKHLERDLVGLRHATYGNGVQGLWQRSREGVLARVVYSRAPSQPSTLRTAAEALVPEAKAQDAPGAFGLPAQPGALWDSRRSSMPKAMSF